MTATELEGKTLIDHALGGRRGTIVAVDLEGLNVTVSWRPGQVTGLRLADIAGGRYGVEVPA